MYKPLFLCALTVFHVTMPAADYSTLGPMMQARIATEMSEWKIGGIAMRVVDDQQIVFADGFGEAKRDSVFRCGSISKLFNALAVMQQVEARKLDLDAPVEQYASDVLPLNPFPGEPSVTLRQILCHRSGLQREAPVGGYMDGSQPTLKATVASIRPCVLATKPGEKTRYSNIAPSLAGHLVERATKLSFEDYQQKRLLEPLGMKSSAWTLAHVPQGRLIRSHMRLADGHSGWIRRDAPDFDLGTIPAGNLYTTAGDLARFCLGAHD
jgi:CubicO group peptidase (beta-lactamase class C family)